MAEKLLLDYGSGGKASHRLVTDLFVANLGNDILGQLDDAALIELNGKVAVSTDSFTVDPIFFPGGDIGSLAVHGTVNDVAMLGAQPLYLTCGFILEEGLDMDDLRRIVVSMGEAAQKAGVLVIAGDTKVVPRGAADKVFINTTGIGKIIAPIPPSGSRAQPGDVVIVSGYMGDHGLAVMGSREGLTFDASVQSDSAALNHMVLSLFEAGLDIHVLRDPTRGGLGTTLNEIATQSEVGIFLAEGDIPIRPAVAAGCSFLGLDPLYLANEGKVICIVAEKDAAKTLEILKGNSLGQDACIIGQVMSEQAGKVILTTSLGGKRMVNMLEGEQLPRIC
ncbi:hydrogenase expression/formation protein HypE [Desulfovibrio inopinatus]|uniref:hydrogenase expression/formation protein HypE n=1 Tax=Desulfovibrio inopinatus TaxID=102109 RepID=UPI0004110750|nr:hydrogenase expression/formation protein HypE [Desulfovibrio inopinatus]